MGDDRLDLDLLLRTFQAEAEETLETMEQALVALESTPGDADLLHEIFRGAHTMKGNAGALGFDGAVDVAHLAEGLLSAMREGHAAVTPSAITLLLQSVDALRRTTADPGAAADEGLLEALRQAGMSGQAGPARDVVRGRGAAPAAMRSDTLRVDVSRLDHLMSVTGELAIVRARLASELADGDRSQAAFEACDQLERLSTELRDTILRLRLVPIGPALRAQVRSVRDLARAAGKLVELRLYGEDVELDTAIVERLHDPLTHLVRNAVAHGIERPEARMARGKDAAGLLTLRAIADGATIVVQITDDGAGLDGDRIAARGRELGLIPAGAGAEAVRNLIFAPGLSTAERVNSVCGRGVGLDAVRTAITAMRGSISVESEPGSGTTFTIRLPLTLSIIDALCVGVGEQTYVVPLDAVLECFDIEEDALQGEGGGVLNVRGSALPYVHLGAALGVENCHGPRRSVLVVRHHERRVGLVLDHLFGKIEAVVKPLGRAFDRLAGIGGATVLANGDVALVLDVPRLLRGGAAA